MAGKVSPLAPESFAELPPLAGVRLAAIEAGIKYSGRKDVLLVALEEGTTVAGTFTQSACASAPVDWCKERIGSGAARALVVNSGNANAFTGMKGASATSETAAAAARALDCEPDEVMLASTGVIGEPLDPGPFHAVMGTLASDLSADAWADAAAAIMTTDTFPKLATARTEIGGVPVTINGIAKGSGMIAPDMATMFSFVFTDAGLPSGVLQALLTPAVAGSFNAVTVDSDTSTSDTVLLFATGKAATPEIADADDPRLADFRNALDGLCRDLAHQIVRDGEGASKFVTIEVTGATSDASARKVAGAIANSPLVKTAIAGEDVNWGRVVMAVGKAGEPADRDRLAIWFGPHRVAVDGERDPDYSEETASAYMKGEEIALRADLGLGEGRAFMWTCDLTHDYISINADYRS